MCAKLAPRRVCSRNAWLRDKQESHSSFQAGVTGIGALGRIQQARAPMVAEFTAAVK